MLEDHQPTEGVVGGLLCISAAFTHRTETHTMSMSMKDYVLVAEVLKKCRDKIEAEDASFKKGALTENGLDAIAEEQMATLEAVVSSLAVAFKADNSRFDAKKFREAVVQ